MKRPTALRFTDAIAPADFTISLPVNNEPYIIASKATVLFPENTLMHLYFSGGITVSLGPPCSFGAGVAGSIGVGGNTFSGLLPGAYKGNTHVTWPSGNYGPPNGTTGVWDGYVIIPKLTTPYVTRDNFYQQYCGTPEGPEFFFSGSTSVQFHRVIPVLNLTVNKPSIVAGDSVLFAASFAPESAGGISLPRSMNWRWSVDDTAFVPQSVPCNWFETTCKFKPARTGTMWYAGVANGQSDSVGKNVAVDTCPPGTLGDSILDTPGVRDSLRALWERSNYHPRTPGLKRLEQGAWIVRNNGVYSLVPGLWVPQPCGIRELPGFRPDSIVGQFHTHPARINEVLTFCGKTRNLDNPLSDTLEYETYSGKESLVDAVSQLALKTFSGINGPSYLIDASQILRYGSNRKKFQRCFY